MLRTVFIALLISAVSASREIIFINFIFAILNVSISAIDESRNGRIIGGNNANLGQYPYHASIRSHGGHVVICGSAILNNRWVVTTARCTMAHVGTSLEVVIGSNIATHGLALRSSRSIRHSQFNRDTGSFDISVVETASTMPLSVNIQPISLGSSFVSGGVNAIVMGFGWTTTENPTNSQTLQYIRTTTITNADCASRLAKVQNIEVFDHTVCTLSGAGQGTCNRDTGGALVSNDVLIGLVRYEMLIKEVF